MADNVMQSGVSVVFGVIVAYIVYEIVNQVDFGTGITDTIMTYIVPLFALGVVATATSAAQSE